MRRLGCFLIVQILSKFVNTSTKQAYFKCTFGQSLSKSLNRVCCTSVLFFLALKSHIHWSNKRRGKLEKNIQKNVYSGHAFSLLDVVRINKPFCEVYQWRIIMQSNPLLKEDLSQRTEMCHFHKDKSKHFA